LLVYIFYGLFILSCIVLVVTVLLQPGKSGAGDLFSSSVSSTAFGPRGTQTLLSKITIGAAVFFMLIALVLSLPGLTGSRSVLQSQPEGQAAPQQATPTPTTAPTQQGTEGGAQTNQNGAQPANTNASTSTTTVAPANSNSSQTQK
jgi:preprotein translocase subunit SecG